jgi:hypothetical protein
METQTQEANSDPKYFIGGAGSDHYVYEVILKMNDNKYVVREMKFEKFITDFIGGYYSVISNPSGETYTVTRRWSNKKNKYGPWKYGKGKYSTMSPYKREGIPTGYRDPSF